ncbi:MAG TPA: GNAT family N-acetyltransferase [Flavobacteriaceae bacterium]|jgi:ribosomal protein S18 acetylase RimI-like enzyme|nr:hypothetical protein [Flavobacteriaceae bacterium]HJO70265.1 GNAT family N-acetyltransferase [Flavobacteriaceae bacterium]|tara:strand:- start:466 stop:906 length:441 start_codon:yes stop_codon:yes gene_type:complete
MSQIREFKNSDLEELRLIFKKNIPQFFSENDLKDFDEYLENNHDTYLVIENKEGLVGGAGYVKENENTGRVTYSFINPKYHRQGFGGILVNQCIKKLKSDKDITCIEVLTSNLAHKFWMKFNFKIKFIKKDYWRKGDDLYFMDQSI